jgi:hypothetical protein
MMIDTLPTELNEQEIKERTGNFLQLVRHTIEVRVCKSFVTNDFFVYVHQQYTICHRLGGWNFHAFCFRRNRSDYFFAASTSFSANFQFNSLSSTASMYIWRSLW